MRRHLLSVDDLSREDIERILGRAESFAEVSGREIKKVPTLRGRTVINLFYEASTRTSSSFELAAKRLSADLVNVKSSGSVGGQGRVAQGHGADALGLRPGGDRDPLAARRRRRRSWRAGRPPSVINAGDGKHEHPTQALLDLYTLRRRVGLARGPVGLDRRRRAAQPRGALGHPGLHADGLRGHGLRPAHADPARDRVARLRRCATRSTASARPTWSTRCGCSTSACRAPSCPRCASTRRATRSTAAGWAPSQLLMHPGPVNRGVELAAEVIDSPQALIAEQVESGRGRADGGALRAARRPRRARRRARVPDETTAPQPA